MRLPSEADLSREQREVCQAPLKGTMLVIGPPGSGKTVVAIFRKEVAANLGVDAEVLVHNRVLRRYTGLDRTFRGWLYSWWYRCTGRNRPPLIHGAGYRAVDYEEAANLLLSSYREGAQEKGNWGHLILDEAQDYSPSAHRFLNVVPSVLFCDVEEPERPTTTILADENQRITGENSTLDDIIGAHQLLNRDIYKLSKNYRNTREIARVARCFHVGATSGVPELPEKRGDKPRFLLTDGYDDVVTRIATYARLHSDQEIGVLVQYKRTRRRLFNKLKHRLRGSGIRVQEYDSEDQDDDELKFDEPGTISALCFSSSKGLEFDAVFLPELQTLRVDGAEEDHASMMLYVMSSRARSQLTIMVDKETPPNSSLWRIFPPESQRAELFDAE